MIREDNLSTGEPVHIAATIHNSDYTTVAMNSIDDAKV